MSANPLRLVDTQATLLQQLESAVDDYLKAEQRIASKSLQAGQNLARIREEGMFGRTSVTWAEYVKQRFGMTKQSANRLIRYSAFVLKVEPVGSTLLQTTPPEERIVRPLYAIPEAQGLQVLSELMSSGKPITQTDVIEAIKPHKPPPEPKPSAHERSADYCMVLHFSRLEECIRAMFYGMPADIFLRMLEAMREFEPKAQQRLQMRRVK